MLSHIFINFYYVLYFLKNKKNVEKELNLNFIKNSFVMLKIKFCRLAYFERSQQWMSYEGLLYEVIRHYTGQVIKQLYVLVLGLDVLGNPFGLVLGVTKGVGDLFYEPIQVNLIIQSIASMVPKYCNSYLDAIFK